jgi:hypothetical protein
MGHSFILNSGRLTILGFIPKQQSPFFNLFIREPLIPIDTLLKPRAKYHGTDYSQVILSENHRAFLTTYEMLKRNKRKRVENANTNRSDVTFRVNDPVY